MRAPFRRLHHTPPLPTPPGPLLAHPDGHPASVQVLEERDGVFPGNPEEVLDVPRPDLLPLAEERDDLVLDRVERRSVKVERLLDAHEPLALEEELEELVLVAAAHAGAAEGLLGTRRRRLGLEELLLDAVHDALLLGRQAHPVGREPDLVPLGRDDALGSQGDDERREHPLVGATRAHPQLLARHSRLERVGAVEGLERRDGERPEARRALGSATGGASRRKRAEAVWPGPSSGVSRRRTRAIISLVPTWKRTRVRDLTARGASSRSSSVPSTRSEETSVPARPTTSPGSTAVRSTPWRLIAVRCPANASATAWPCVCRPRIFASPPFG